MLVLKIPLFLIGVVCLFIGGFAGVFPTIISARINWLCLGLAFIAASYLI